MADATQGAAIHLAGSHEPREGQDGVEKDFPLHDGGTQQKAVDELASSKSERETEKNHRDVLCLSATPSVSCPAASSSSSSPCPSAAPCFSPCLTPPSASSVSVAAPGPAAPLSAPPQQSGAPTASSKSSAPPPVGSQAAPNSASASASCASSAEVPVSHTPPSLAPPPRMIFPSAELNTASPPPPATLLGFVPAWGSSGSVGFLRAPPPLAPRAWSGGAAAVAQEPLPMLRPASSLGGEKRGTEALSSSLASPPPDAHAQPKASKRRRRNAASCASRTPAGAPSSSPPLSPSTPQLLASPSKQEDDPPRTAKRGKTEAKGGTKKAAKEGSAGKNPSGQKTPQRQVPSHLSPPTSPPVAQSPGVGATQPEASRRLPRACTSVPLGEKAKGDDAAGGDACHQSFLLHSGQQLEAAAELIPRRRGKPFAEEANAEDVNSDPLSGGDVARHQLLLQLRDKLASAAIQTRNSSAVPCLSASVFLTSSRSGACSSCFSETPAGPLRSGAAASTGAGQTDCPQGPSRAPGKGDGAIGVQGARSEGHPADRLISQPLPAFLSIAHLFQQFDRLRQDASAGQSDPKRNVEILSPAFLLSLLSKEALSATSAAAAAGFPQKDSECERAGTSNCSKLPSARCPSQQVPAPDETISGASASCRAAQGVSGAVKARVAGPKSGSRNPTKGTGEANANLRSRLHALEMSQSLAAGSSGSPQMTSPSQPAERTLSSVQSPEHVTRTAGASSEQASRDAAAACGGRRPKRPSLSSCTLSAGGPAAPDLVDQRLPVDENVSPPGAAVGTALWVNDAGADRSRPANATDGGLSLPSAGFLPGKNTAESGVDANALGQRGRGGTRKGSKEETGGDKLRGGEAEGEARGGDPVKVASLPGGVAGSAASSTGEEARRPLGAGAAAEPQQKDWSRDAKREKATRASLKTAGGHGASLPSSRSRGASKSHAKKDPLTQRSGAPPASAPAPPGATAVVYQTDLGSLSAVDPVALTAGCGASNGTFTCCRRKLFCDHDIFGLLAAFGHAAAMTGDGTRGGDTCLLRTGEVPGSSGSPPSARTSPWVPRGAPANHALPSVEGDGEHAKCEASKETLSSEKSESEPGENRRHTGAKGVPATHMRPGDFASLRARSHDEELWRPRLVDLLHAGEGERDGDEWRARDVLSFVLWREDAKQVEACDGRGSLDSQRERAETHEDDSEDDLRSGSDNDWEDGDPFAWLESEDKTEPPLEELRTDICSLLRTFFYFLHDFVEGLRPELLQAYREHFAFLSSATKVSHLRIYEPVLWRLKCRPASLWTRLSIQLTFAELEALRELHSHRRSTCNALLTHAVLSTLFNPPFAAPPTRADTMARSESTHSPFAFAFATSAPRCPSQSSSSSTSPSLSSLSVCSASGALSQLLEPLSFPQVRSPSPCSRVLSSSAGSPAPADRLRPHAPKESASFGSSAAPLPAPQPLEEKLESPRTVAKRQEHSRSPTDVARDDTVAAAAVGLQTRPLPRVAAAGALQPPAVTFGQSVGGMNQAGTGVAVKTKDDGEATASVAPPKPAASLQSTATDGALAASSLVRTGEGVSGLQNGAVTESRSPGSSSEAATNLAHEIDPASLCAARRLPGSGCAAGAPP
ncbi:hypothetical protein BESB_044330 [Besnoitia besnoiti]|uniref:Uncharacterized protein n=1 Tax=Besnoitia besnoiti TaxID=94643 RepID=A0A2A9MJ12_BESBE|nr:hypothetical protein BESB_044330 [Besnoitia besnoiti]PFH36241.1 hypothetical protein BESB_044330 [Besnoitia besnoiti]